MISLLNSKNKRGGDSKSIYPIHVVDDEDDAIHVETDPAETVKHNFNTLLLYIIKMLMNNTKNPYDGFKVDNYLLFENSDTNGENNKILSKVPALHKPDRSIKTDNFDDIENLIMAQLTIQEGDQTRFHILNPNIHKGWSRDGDDTVLQTLIDNLINTTSSTKGGAKQKLNGGSQTQPIFQQIRDAQISDIEPFKMYALSINKEDHYQRMEKEITDTISKFESEYEKTSNYNKKVGIMVELSNSLFQKKIQTFKIFSRDALEIIKELRMKTQLFDIEKQKYEKKLTDMKKQLLDKTNNYSNVSELNEKLKNYLRYKKSSDINERVDAARQLLEVFKTRCAVEPQIRDKVKFLLNSTEIHTELSELLKISNSIPNKDFEILKKSLERAQQTISDLNKITDKLGNDLDSKSHELEMERNTNLEQLHEVRERHAQQIAQLHSERQVELAKLASLQLASTEQQERLSQIEEEYEQHFRSLQDDHQNELDTLQEQHNSALQETAQQYRELESIHQGEISRLTTDADESAQRRINAKVEEADERIRNLEDRHETQIRTLKDKADAASAEASAAASATRDGREAVANEIKRLNAEKEKDIKDLEENYKAERDDLLQQRENSIRDLSENLQQMKQTHKTEIDALRAEKQKNQEELKTAISEKSNLESTAQKFSKLEAAFHEGQNRIATLLQYQGEILQESSDNRENYERARDTVKRMSAMIEELQNENAAKTLQIDSISVEYLNKTGAKLLELNREFKGVVAKLEKDLKDCKDEIARLKKELLKTNEDINRIERERVECLEKLKSISLENKTLKIKIEQMTKTETSSTNEARTLRKDIETLHASKREITEERDAAKAANLRMKNDCINRKIDQLQEENDGLRASASEANEINAQKLADQTEESGRVIKKVEERLQSAIDDKTQMESALRAQVSDCQKKLTKSEETLDSKSLLVDSLTNQLKESNEIIQQQDHDIGILSGSNDSLSKSNESLIKSISKSNMEHDVALGEIRAEAQKAEQARLKAEREMDQVREEARQEKEGLAASETVRSEEIDRLIAEIEATIEGEAPEAAAADAAAASDDNQAYERLRMAAAASNASNKMTIDLLKDQVKQLQKTKEPSENEKRVYNEYIKHIGKLTLTAPYEEGVTTSSEKLEVIKEYIVSEIPNYFLEKNIQIINKKNDIEQLQQAVALDIVVYILKSIAGEGLISKLKKTPTEQATYRDEALKFVVSIPKKGIPEIMRENVATYFNHMISSDAPQTSSLTIKSSTLPKPSIKSRYVKKLHSSFNEKPIGSVYLWTNIKENVLFSPTLPLGPNDNIVRTVQQMISSIIPHIRGMLNYFEDRVFGDRELDSPKKKKDGFLHKDNIDTPQQHVLREFLTELKNNSPDTMIKGFSANILTQNQQIDELHTIIASKAVPRESRFGSGGSSSKLVYSLKKRKSNKGNKTKRHKGNKSK
tara:strand:- start:6092 stop:10435 length:4344 start_codon:yes stop_codon:yes gene_type:complete